MGLAVLNAIADHAAAAMTAGGVSPVVVRGPDHTLYDRQVYRAFVFSESIEPTRAALSPSVYEHSVSVRIAQPLLDKPEDAPEAIPLGIVDALMARLRNDVTLGGRARRVELGAVAASFDAEYAEGRRDVVVSIPVLTE